MDQVAALSSRAIDEILIPTFQIFSPLLQANSISIKASPPTTHSYSTHNRQKVDVYTPLKSPSTFSINNGPILIFLYGGGLGSGAKILPSALFPSSTVYTNLGTFFALRGITTLIPDYRLVTPSPTHTDATFPSGADDIAALLAWLSNTYLSSSSPPRSVYIMGNSAGGVHLSTFLLSRQFLSTRRLYSEKEKSQNQSLNQTALLKGAILFAVPFHFRNAHPERKDVLRAYYGCEPHKIMEKCPFGLLEGLEAEDKHPEDFGIPKLLNLEGEFDPEDEILEPGRDFVKLWGEKFAGGGMEEWFLKGHNHISPPVALMSGDGEGERWGEDLVGWMNR